MKQIKKSLSVFVVAIFIVSGLLSNGTAKAAIVPNESINYAETNTTIKIFDTTVKAATFGATVNVILTTDGIKIFPTVTKYQIIDGVKPISAITNLGMATIIFPAKAAGSKVSVKLYDANAKVIVEIEVLLGQSGTIENSNIENLDFNNDGIINTGDLASLSTTYNFKSSDSSWNSKYDVNGDNVIDIFDLAKVSKAVGTITLTDNTDITSKFTDENFKNNVYSIIGKSSPSSILYSDVKNIEAVSMASKNISNVNGIDYFTAITSLNLSGNKINSIEPLRGLTNLTTLYLAGNEITDYTPVNLYYHNLINKDFQLISNVASVGLNKTTVSLTVGEIDTLIATFNPTDAINKAVKWSSSDNNIATVDNTGKVKAVSAGTAIIIVTTEDGGKSASCTVMVNNPVGTVVIATVKAAIFGALVTVTSNTTGAVNYQILDGAKVISGIAPLGTATTIFPAKVAGDKVSVRLTNAAGAVIATSEVTLVAPK